METEEVKQINYEEENKNEIQSEDDYISLEDFYLQSCRYG